MISSFDGKPSLRQRRRQRTYRCSCHQVGVHIAKRLRMRQNPMILSLFFYGLQLAPTLVQRDSHVRGAPRSQLNWIVQGSFACQMRGRACLPMGLLTKTPGKWDQFESGSNLDPKDSIKKGGCFTQHWDQGLWVRNSHILTESCPWF